MIFSQLQYCAVTNPLSRITKTDGNILLFSLLQAKYMARWIGSNCEVKTQTSFLPLSLKVVIYCLFSPVNSNKLKCWCNVSFWRRLSLVYRNQIYLEKLLTKRMYLDPISIFSQKRKISLNST